MSGVLMTGGHVYSPEDPFATALLVVDGRIAWIGDDAGAMTHAADAHERVHLGGAWVAPAFVDAHVHLTATGLALTGLDLAGAGSMAEALHRLRAAAEVSEGVIIGHGWDETSWPEGRAPTTAEVDACVGDRPAYLSRVDVHSALVSRALREQVPAARTLDGWSSQEPVARAAHHALREAALGSITAEQRARAQRSALTEAATQGIASVHENAGPTISGPDDLVAALELGADPGLPEVVGYWGQLHGQEMALSLRARGAAGRQLKEATRLLDRGDTGAFLAELVRALQQLMTDRHGVAARGLTHAELASRLASMGLTAEDAQALQTLMERCDAGRYAPQLVEPSSLPSLLDEASRLVVELGRIRPGRSS